LSEENKAYRRIVLEDPNHTRILRSHLLSTVELLYFAHYTLGLEISGPYRLSKGKYGTVWDYHALYPKSWFEERSFKLPKE
jgi:hypothetical protein